MIAGGATVIDLAAYLGAQCGSLSPESKVQCYLRAGHEHGHRGQHPNGEPGWAVSWARRVGEA